MPEVVALDFYEPDGTTLIGTLDDSQLLECEARPALQELGALRFVVSRHLAAASSALLAKGNLVKYRVPAIDVEPIALFVLKDDISQLISREEQGGETLEVTGPGGLWLLQHARLNEVPSSTNPALTNPTFRGSYQIPGQWTWHGEPYGAILRRCIEEGQEQDGNPLGAITPDFDRDLDSNGVAWAVIPEDFQVPIGTDVLAMAERLAAAGDLFLILTPDMVLHAYQTFGRDLTGAFAADNVRFEKGINTQTELTRKTDFDRVTHLITRDMDAVYRTYETPDPYSQAVYGFLDIDWTNDEPQVEKTALNTLAASDLAAEPYTLEISPGLVPEDGEYLPGPTGTSGHFWLADEVTLHNGSGEHDLNNVGCRVTAVSIVLDQASDAVTDARAARSLHIVPELFTGMPEPRFSGVGNGAGSHSVASISPRFCDGGPSDVLFGLTGSVLKVSSVQGAFTKDKAVDGDYNSHWSGANGTDPPESYWAADIATAQRIIAYRILQGVYSTGSYTGTPVATNTATEIRIYGSNDAAAWAWLPSGSLTADPASNGWVLVDTDTSGAGPAPGGDSGVQTIPTPGIYRYWLFRAVTGGSGGNSWDVGTLSLFIDSNKPAPLAQDGEGTDGECSCYARGCHEHEHGNLSLSVGPHHRIEAITTAETDSDLVFAPDGAGGIEARAESGGSVSKQIHTFQMMNDVGGVTIPVNSTTYLVVAYLLSRTDFDVVPWTHFAISCWGNSNAAAQTITIQGVHGVGAGTLSAAGNDLVLDNSFDHNGTGWIAIDPTLTGLQHVGLALKGSNSTVDLVVQSLDLLLKYDP